MFTIFLLFFGDGSNLLRVWVPCFDVSQIEDTNGIQNTSGVYLIVRIFNNIKNLLCYIKTGFTNVWYTNSFCTEVSWDSSFKYQTLERMERMQVVTFFRSNSVVNKEVLLCIFIKNMRSQCVSMYITTRPSRDKNKLSFNVKW